MTAYGRTKKGRLTKREKLVGLISARSPKSSSSSSSSESSIRSEALFCGTIGFGREPFDEVLEGGASAVVLGLMGSGRGKNLEIFWSRRGIAGFSGSLGGLLACCGGDEEREESEAGGGGDALFRVVLGFETTWVGWVT